jgi:hypothetical protein
VAAGLAVANCAPAYFAPPHGRPGRRSQWRPPVKTRVCISVDVEPSVAGAFEQPDRLQPLIHQPIAGQVDGRSEGLGFILRTLRETGLTATFFVESLHPAYFGESEMGRYVEDLLAHDQDVQLHIHPLWLTFRDGKPDLANFVSDECAIHPEPRLVELLERGRAQLERWTGAIPLALRTGNFSTSHAVFRAMSGLGLRTSSNICTAIAPPAEEALRLPGGAHRIEGVTEFPVTCFRDPGPVGRNRFRGMQITACARWEFRALLEGAQQLGYPHVVIVTHPFEFVKSDGVRYTKMTVNRINQQRFRWLCAFLAENSDRFTVTPMRDLAREVPSEINQPLPELSGETLSSLLRSAQNVLNDRLWAL